MFFVFYADYSKDGGTIMGLFGKKKEMVQLADDARCCKCHKRIRRDDRFTVLDGRLYCEKCGKRKRDLDAIEFALIMEDD